MITTNSLVECIPNISEGRRTDVINTIVSTVEQTDGVMLLDRTSDTDHNRTVLTLAGHPEAVLTAVFRLIKTATSLIDMEKHQGVHPRLGAVDVVPFVPLRHSTLEDCVMLAQRLGKMVGDDLNLPVYLYEAAATQPTRRNLADVRRGEYELLKQNIDLPQNQPDFGLATVGKAGAVIIGARHPLIAYNVYLNTDDITIARRIAKAIRHSSGGLAGVKALGLLVAGQAQVSMNITDYKRTPLHRVMNMIRNEAMSYGAAVTRSELIGLIPEDALLDAAAHYLQLHDLSAAHVLENRLKDDL